MTMYSGYAGKDRTDSNIAWHRPQLATSRVEAELMEKSSRALEHVTNPLEKLRLLCLARGATGIMAFGRIIRKSDTEGNNILNKKQFLAAIKHTKLDVTNEDVEKLFSHFDTDNNGYMDIGDFIEQLRPPMSESRHRVVTRCFQKLDKAGTGIISVDDLRRVYSLTSSKSYMTGEESAELTMQNFLDHFQLECADAGKVTEEEFMNYYSGISSSIDDDCFFDLLLRQAYKL